jgi:hypothetical protein
MCVTLQLISTTHCHLCEQAEALVAALVEQYKFEWTIVEISDDTELLERYASTIPVLKKLNSNLEISWPFGSAEIEILLTT